jgi:hypothetical protein
VSWAELAELVAASVVGRTVEAAAEEFAASVGS